MCCVCCRHIWLQVLASTCKPCWRTTSLLSASPHGSHASTTPWWMHGLWTPPHKPPSRGMHASSSRCAPMSSARTPTRVGFNGGWVCKLLARINHFRSTDGGCAARQHRSEATGGGRRTRQRGGFSKLGRQRNWNLTPINPAQNRLCTGQASKTQALAKPSMPWAKACRACANICNFHVSVSV